MKMKKTELKWFSIMDYEKEAAYLSLMHRNGWKFRSVSLPGIYRFDKCEPEEMVYQLDYNPEGGRNRDEYIQMFSDCGWEYLLDFVGYSYFRKPAAEMQGSEEIFCDDESRADMLRRIFRGRMLPLVFLFCFLVFSAVHSGLTGNHSMLVLDLILIAVYVTIFVQFALRYRDFMKRMRS